MLRILCILLFICRAGFTAELEPIRVSDDKTGFVREKSKTPFVPWGFNYDHDDGGRLIEDYWDAEWPKIETAFRDMKKMGANVTRIHLQFGKFMESAAKPNEKALAKLADLVALAEKTELYIDLTGLACYHKEDTPAWYEALSEQERWAAQAVFWEAVAARCAKSPAIFCYDLMNEPVSPVAKRKEWITGKFGNSYFIQCIALDPAGRTSTQIAKAWIKMLVAAIRKTGAKQMVTVGELHGTAQRADAWSGFDPKELDELDYISVHIYPEKGKVDEALKILEKFSVGKPVVIEETFVLKCGPDEFGKFFEQSKKHASGWIGFYWGKPPEELRESKKIGDKIMLSWLDFFTANAPK